MLGTCLKLFTKFLQNKSSLLKNFLNKLTPKTKGLISNTREINGTGVVTILFIGKVVAIINVVASSVVWNTAAIIAGELRVLAGRGWGVVWAIAWPNEPAIVGRGVRGHNPRRLLFT